MTTTTINLNNVQGRGTPPRTAAQWVADNPILPANYLGFETDTGKYKLGDGVSVWNVLTYPSFGGGVTTLEGLSGAINLVAGTNVTITDNGTDSITISSTATISDGDKGDITVSASGATWTIDNGVVTDSKISTGIDAAKIADGSVSNTEFEYLDGVTSAIQTQLDSKASLSGATFTGAVNVNANLAVDTDTLFVDSVNNRVGIGTSSPTYVVDMLQTSAQISAISSLSTAIGRSFFAGYDTGSVRRGLQFGVRNTGGGFIQNIDGAGGYGFEIQPFGGELVVGSSTGGFAGKLAVTRGVGGINIWSRAWATSDIPLVLQAAAGQTANLQEWKDSSGNVLASIGSAGKLSIGASGGLRYTPSATRYTDYSGLNLGGGLYMSFPSTAHDAFISLVGGGTNSNVYMYWRSDGRINSRGDMLLGAADGAATVAGPTASAQLEIRSTTRGFLPPRMTGAQVEAISSPAEGLMAYATSAGSGDVTAAGAYLYNGSNWELMSLQTELDTKQDTLVNQVNLKSINGTSLLGSGDLTVGGGLAGTIYVFVSANGTDTENAAELQAAYNLAKTKTSVVNTWVPLISGGFFFVSASTISEFLSPSVSFPWVYGQTYDIRLDGTQYTGVDNGSNSFQVDLVSVTAPDGFYSDLEVLGTSITRAVVVVAPGNFNFSSNFVVDGEAVDIVSLDGNRSVVFNGAGTISVTANDVFLKGIDVGDKSFALATNLSSIVVENCKGGNNSFGSTGIASGTFIDCEAGTFSFGGTASGIFRNCKATSDSFGRNGTASGTFIDCVGGGTCFSYAGNASGRFINCEGGSSSFGGGGTASGTFINCRSTSGAFGNYIATASGVFTNCQGGNSSFGQYGTASGTFTNCQAGNTSFGNAGTASGVFNSCIGGTNSFGNGSGGVLSGKLYYCRLTSGTFKTVSSGGKTRLCIDGNDSENNQG